jgi:hypothetical protein
VIGGSRLLGEPPGPAGRVFRKLGVRSQVELARVVEQGAARARTMAAIGLQVRAAEVSVPPAATELKWELAQVADGLMDVLRDVRGSPAVSTR